MRSNDRPPCQRQAVNYNEAKRLKKDLCFVMYQFLEIQIWIWFPHSAGLGGWGSTVTPLAGKQQPRAGALHRQESDLTDEPQTYFSSLRMR